VAARIQRGATEEISGWPDAFGLRQAVGRQIGYINPQTLKTSATEKRGDVGAALEFFQSMDGDALDSVGVTIVEGDYPGSTYYAAELTGDIDAANKAAALAGIPVRFKESSR
jgi:hypothetical protein